MKTPLREALPFLLFLSMWPVAPAGETDRVLCDPESGGPCMPDVAKVVILGTDHPDESVLELADFVPGTRVDTQIVFCAVTENIQGWSYGVAHDPGFLTLVETSVTTLGTIVEALSQQPSFQQNLAVDGGYISAVVLSLLGGVSLPLGRNSVCSANYTLVADPGTEGAMIRFVDGELGVPGAPPIEINIVADGVSRRPETVSEGLVRVRGTTVPLFVRGDINADGRINLTDPIAMLHVLLAGLDRPFDCVAVSDIDADGTVNLADAVSLLSWMFRQGPSPAEPFPTCGTAPASNADCRVSSPNCEG